MRLTDPPAGVRSTAMGGSADLLATDPGAAIDNPAALAATKTIAMAVAGTRSSFRSESVPVKGYAILFRDSTRGSGISQFGVAVPVGGVVLSGYFVDQPRFRSDPSLAAEAGGDRYVPVADPFYGFIFSPQPRFDLRDRRFGSAIAWQMGNVQVGIGGEFRQLDERTATVRTPLLTSGEAGMSERLFRTTNGNAFIPAAGIVWRASRRISIGAAYKGGGTFHRTTEVCGLDRPGASQCQTEIARLHSGTQKMPDRYRVALAVQATRGLALTAAVVRQEYGVFEHEPYGLLGLPTLMPYHNVIEPHGGAEYRFDRWPVALRAGLWRDPSHITQFPGASDWSKGINHKTFGAGVMLKQTELSIAVDDGGAHGGRRAIVGLTHTF